ncbi:MAG: phosphoethanolamine transferase CptA, partial [Candidatus Bathyarchaeota archaeon]|jgi:hypothetical protein|nr:phosphoethanolamine transferase CptA [Candidatus Bathyarchaeota archaeon]
MLSVFIVGLIGVIGLIVVGMLALFLVPFLVSLIPVAIVGIVLWTGFRVLAGLAWFVIMGVFSVLQSIWFALF